MADFVFNRSPFNLPRIGLIVQLLSIEINDLALIVKLDDDFPWHNMGRWNLNMKTEYGGQGGWKQNCGLEIMHFT